MKIACRLIIDGVHDNEYACDLFRRRIKKTVSGTTTHFHYDLQGRLIAETARDGTALRDYIYQNGNLVAVKLHGIQAGVYYVISDHLGTPQQIVDSTGTVVWKAAYFPFGKAQILTETITNNIRFPGQYFDAETGLHYNWNRYYDPDTGRYLTPDPIGLVGGMNLYAYVGGDPVNWIDPLGLAPFTNNCDKAVCFKPESSKDGYDGTKKYECPPGRTCDADGVYPPDGSNPIRVC